MKEIKRIFLDYASTTPVDKRVSEVLNHFYTHKWGNTSGIHHFAKNMEHELYKAREQMARYLNTKESEIIFTSSATESNNTILKGIAESYGNKGKHIITSQIEHASVRETCRYLAEKGYEITYLPVDESGLVDPDALNENIRPDTILVSIIYVNNELGTIQHLNELGKNCKARGVFFHTDAVQALGKLAVDLKQLNIDLLTASAHKIYGPIGAGLIYCREGIEFKPLLHGGGQEDGLRASTVNVPAIAGFAKAMEIYENIRDSEKILMKQFRNQFEQQILSAIPDVQINSSPLYSIPNILNVSFNNTDGEFLAMQLDKEGVAVSTGSACHSGKVDVSHVLKACRIKKSWAQGTIRFSFGRNTTQEEISIVGNMLPELVNKVRKLA